MKAAVERSRRMSRCAACLRERLTNPKKKVYRAKVYSRTAGEWLCLRHYNELPEAHSLSDFMRRR